jgi:hypothetical protein
MRISRQQLIVLVLIGGSSLALQQCGTPAPAAVPGQAQFRTVGSVKQLMGGMMAPASARIWDAAVYVNGQARNEPTTDDDWSQLEAAAVTLAESGNLLQIGDRVRDNGKWLTYAQQLTTASEAAVRAANSRNIETLISTGSDVYTVCANCHRDYIEADDPLVARP